MPTVTLPGIGPIKTTYLYAGAAAAAGIVGYAWFTRDRAAVDADLPAADADVGYDAFGNPLEPGGSPDYVPPTVVDSNVDVDASTGFATNAEWSQYAVGVLVSYGISAAAASSAVGKYLDRRPLNAVEQDLVRQAVAAAGNPPQNGPFQIVEEGGAAIGMGVPAGLRAVVNADRTVTLTWSAVSGASGYQIRRDSGPGSPRTASATATGHRTSVLAPGTYRYEVRARNTANQFGDPAVATVTVTASVAKVGAPTGVRATAGRSGGFFTVTWKAVPGATGYRIRREGSNAPNTWAKVGPATPYWSSHVRGLRRPTKFAFRVQALGPGGSFGGNRVSNAVTVRP